MVILCEHSTIRHKQRKERKKGLCSSDHFVFAFSIMRLREKEEKRGKRGCVKIVEVLNPRMD